MKHTSMSEKSQSSEEQYTITIEDKSSHTSERVEVINDAEGSMIPKSHSHSKTKKVSLDNIKRKKD